MSQPEFVSVEYQPIIAKEIVFSPQIDEFGDLEMQPFPARDDLEVPQEEVDRFLTERILDTTDIDVVGDTACGSVFFMTRAVARIRHSEDITTQNNFSFRNGNEEIVNGRNFVTSDYFVPTAHEDNMTVFAPLRELVNADEINDYTADIVKRTRANGRHSTMVTRYLEHLIDPQIAPYTERMKSLGLEDNYLGSS